MGNCIMAIDQGTTGTRVILVDKEGRELACAYTEFLQIYPRPGWVEHDAEVIWQSTLQVMRQAMESAAVKPGDIAGIGITNQRETTILWDRATLRPVHNAIVWQCRRSASICDELKNRGLEPLFHEKTGLLLDAYFSATKLKWLLDTIPGLRERARKGELAFGTVDSWLVARLTGGKTHVTDYTNASRTLLYNIHEKCWDEELLRILDIPAAILPEVVPSAGVICKSDPAITTAALPIAGIAGDQQASLFGQACFEPGQAKNTYGTGCFLLLNTGNEKTVVPKGLIQTLACTEDGRPCYAVEGSIFMGGAVIQWLRDELGIIKDAAETQAIAQSVPDTQGVYLVPAFAGLGAPYWDMYARGGILGLSRGSTRAHIVRAALEALAYQIKDLIGTFETGTGKTITELRVDGGACRNDFLMQFQADILNCTIDRSQYIESTGMGAAFLAGIATGFWEPGAQISALRASERTFSPAISESKRQKLFKGWLDAVNRVKSAC